MNNATAPAGNLSPAAIKRAFRVAHSVTLPQGVTMTARRNYPGQTLEVILERNGLVGGFAVSHPIDHQTMKSAIYRVAAELGTGGQESDEGSSG